MKLRYFICDIKVVIIYHLTPYSPEILSLILFLLHQSLKHGNTKLHQATRSFDGIFKMLSHNVPQFEVRSAHCAVLCLVVQPCLTLCDPMDCSLSGSSVLGDSPAENAGIPRPLPGGLPKPGVKPRAPQLQADSLPPETQGSPSLVILLLIFQGLMLSLLPGSLSHFLCLWVSALPLGFYNILYFPPSKHICYNCAFWNSIPQGWM